MLLNKSAVIDDESATVIASVTIPKKATCATTSADKYIVSAISAGKVPIAETVEEEYVVSDIAVEKSTVAVTALDVYIDSSMNTEKITGPTEETGSPANGISAKEAIPNIAPYFLSEF
jgi:hypothetical protein